MSAGPFYAGQPYAKTARLTTGDNSLTAPTVKSLIFDPAENASGKTAGACQRITAAPLGTISSATAIHIFRSHDGGTTLSYLFSIPVGPSALANGVMPVVEQSAAKDAYTLRYPILTGAGDTLWASVNDTVVGVDVTAQGGIG